MSRRTIVIGTLQESGHLNPTFKLARMLRARGHDVRYFAIPDLAPRIVAQGFTTLPWFPDLFPEGFFARQDALGLLDRRRGITARFEEIAERLLRGEGACAELERLRPDMLLADVSEPLLGMLAAHRGLPATLINTSLPQTRDPGVPPLRCDDRYAPDTLSRVRSDLRWRRFLLGRRVSAALADAIAMCPPYELVRRVAPRFGIAPEQLDCETMYLPQLRGLPELVLCPESFDFPRPARPDRHFVESIDLERSEPVFDWNAIAEDKPLVYCAFGEQRYQPEAVTRVFEHLLAVLGERPDWHLLLARGRHHLPDVRLDRLRNVTVVDRAPQLATLRRARVMITHGGLGSVKECIAHGVPMLVFPLAIDQPGNAGRIAYHGIGVQGDVRRTSAPKLRTLLERLLDEPSIAARAAAMRQRVERFEHGQRGADLVEHWIARAETRSESRH